MQRCELEELHYITPIENLGSVCELGILSHARARVVEHTSVAMVEIQDIRSEKIVPQGRRLHEYVNLYFHARNPMMWIRRDQHECLCVLRVSPNVLDVPGAVVTDQNASPGSAFAPARRRDRYQLTAKYVRRDWTHPDQITYWRWKSMKCAEVLVPDQVAT